MAARGESPVSYVQIDGLVTLKIIKHCQEEGAGGTELVQGVLLGLVVDNRLEITNCFPFPRHGDDEEFDVSYQMEMMRNLRHVNIDHLHVGWYQSTYFGSFLNKALLDSQFNYQNSIDESVVLIYDPLRTAKGTLCLRAYRLTEAMMKVYRDGDFAPEAIKKGKISFENMFEEVPVVIKNSHLTNTLLCDLEEDQQAANCSKHQLLDLATSSVLEKNMRLMMECVDELSQDANKYFNYQRQCMRQNQAKQAYIQKRKTENELRAVHGEQPLPEDDLTKMFKTPQPPPRLDGLLIAGQVNSYADQINEFATQSFGKMFMADSLQESEKPDPLLN